MYLIYKSINYKYIWKNKPSLVLYNALHVLKVQSLRVQINYGYFWITLNLDILQ